MLERIFISSVFIFTYTLSLFAQCDIQASQTTICVSETVDFKVINPNPGSEYSWDIDNDGTSDLKGSSFSREFPIVFQDTIFTIGLFQDGQVCGTQDIEMQASPDPSIGILPGTASLDGTSIKTCNGAETFELELFNASSTLIENVRYSINWGDGSPSENFDNNSFSNTQTISHTYARLGYYNIFITAEHQNGCSLSKTYTFYNGGNPSVGFALPGNTVGLCAPATLDFPITNTESNPPGTEYKIYVSGELVAEYTQENLPGVFTYTFEENSCGATTSTNNYQNAFDLRIVVSNPCNSSTATIEPIEVSSPPEPYFEVAPPSNQCEGGVYSVVNKTPNIREVISGSPSSCVDILSPSWSISGEAGSDWELRSGNLFGAQKLDIEFLKPGTYTIEMTLFSFACGEVTFSQTIRVYEPPSVNAGLDFNANPGGPGSACTPFDLPLQANTSGDSIQIEWDIRPRKGWEFLNDANAQSLNPTLRFESGGNFKIRLNATNPCTTEIWDTTIFIPGPPSIEIIPIPDACEQTELNFTPENLEYFENGSPITNITWTFAGSDQKISQDSFPMKIIYDQAGTYILSLDLENACGLTTHLDTFEVQQPSDLVLSPDTSLCISSELISLDAIPKGGKWSGPGIQGKTKFNPQKAGVGIHQLLYQYGTGACRSEETLEIQIHSLPPVEAGAPVELCADADALALSAQPAGGLWEGPESLISNQNEFLPAQAGAGDFRLYYTYTDANQCTAKDSLDIIIHPMPKLVVGDTSYCNKPGELDLPLPNREGGRWEGPGVTSPKGKFDPLAAGGAGKYKLTYTFHSKNGCTSVAQVKVGIVDPENIDAGRDTSICGGDEIYDLSEYTSLPGGEWISDSRGLQDGLFNPMAAGSGAHRITYIVGKGSCMVEDSVFIDVIALPSVEAGDYLEICPETPPILLEDQTPSGGSWSGDGLLSQGSESLFDPSIAGTGEFSLKYTIVDPVSGCQNAATKKIKVLPSPEPEFKLPKTLCVDVPIKFKNQSTGSSSFTWLVNGEIISKKDSPEHQFNRPGEYEVKLVVKSADGCRANRNRKTIVASPPLLDFEKNTNDNCGLAVVEFENKSQGYETQYRWDFGNGRIFEGEQPNFPIVYRTGQLDTTYFLSLEATNLCGNQIVKDSVLVKSLPLADFGFTVDTGCAPIQVNFTNISRGGAENFYWDFGEGRTFMGYQPDPQFFGSREASETYEILLIAENSCGKDTLIKPITIEAEQVDAFINVSRQRGCAPFSVEFEHFSTPGARVSWDFGDGMNSLQPAPVHTYEEAGAYRIWLYARNACTQDSASIEIFVEAPPEIDFSYSDNTCIDQSIQFTNQSDRLEDWFWKLSEGDTSRQRNPIFSFSEPGTYTVSLQGRALDNGCPAILSKSIEIGAAPIPIFDLSEASGCAPLNVRFSNQSAEGLFYLWDFGDGNTASTQNPTHTFLEEGNFTVKLNVSDDKGCTTDTVFQWIQVHPIPNADFVFEKEKSCGLPVQISFQNQSENADDFLWQFGGEVTSRLNNPNITFSRAGKYPVKLRATNRYGCQAETEQDFELFDQPVAVFDLEGAVGCNPLPILFANFSEGDLFYWDFGDGTQSTERVPQHIYRQPGIYDVKLITSYGDVCFDTLQVQEAVQVKPSPIARFSWKTENLQGAFKGLIQFINESIGADQYSWDFGDGQFSKESDPQHRYFEQGQKSVRLEVTSPEGCKSDTLFAFVPDLFGSLFVPNAISPDQGLGEAQFFLPKGMGLKEYRLQIFSTYGQLIWESTDLEEGQPVEGWDGTQNGAALPQDVYVWKIEATFEDGTRWTGAPQKGGGYSRMGTVTLLR